MALLKIRPFLRLNSPIPYNILGKRLEGTCAEQSLPQKFLLEDKVAVITGAASGIGFEIAKEFLQQGISAVSLIDIDEGRLTESVKALQKEYGDDRVIKNEADVADTEQMDNAFRNTSLHFETIDMIVNNAGILDDTNWEKQLNTNMRGSVIGTLLGMQYMAKSSSGEGGLIINVGSIMSVTPSCGFPIHTMTQFGIAGFTRALGSSRLYERTGVRVFGYCPSITDTMTMTALADKAINHNFAAEFQEEIKNIVIQDPANVAKGLVDILKDAKPGSIWIAENNNSPFEVEFPKVLERKRTESNGSEQAISNATK